MWGGLFSTFDCAVKGVRQKEDPYNASKFFGLCILVRCGVAGDGDGVLIVCVRTGSYRGLPDGRRARGARGREGGGKWRGGVCVFTGGD